MLVQARVRSERAAGPKQHRKSCAVSAPTAKNISLAFVLLAKSLAILPICNRHYFCPNFTPVPSSTRPCILTKARSLV